MFAAPETLAVLVWMETHHIAMQAIGAVGSVIYVGGYLLVQCGHLCGNSVAYPLSKALAALCVMASLATAFNLATLLIQICFLAISIYGLWYRLSGRFAARRTRLSHSESTRRKSLAGVGAWPPREMVPDTPPQVSVRPVGDRGHCGSPQWPRTCGLD